MTPAGGGGAGRATATVLFTDLVGSTELRSRLGENAAEDLRQLTPMPAIVAGRAKDKSLSPGSHSGLTSNVHFFEPIGRYHQRITPEGWARITELKAEIQAVRSELKADIAAVGAEIALVEYRMMTRLGGAIAAAVGIILAAIRYLPHS